MIGRERWLVIGAIAVLGACGGDDGHGGQADAEAGADVYHCDSVAQDEQCSDYSAATEAQIEEFKTRCTGLLMGALVDACPTGMVGGCRRADASESSTVWYYPPTTVDDVECGDSATFVPPP